VFEQLQDAPPATTLHVPPLHGLPAQGSSQAPRTQSSTPHELPHSPQLLASFWRSTQRLPH